MVMYGVWSYERDRLIDLTGRKAMQLSDVIVAGLRSSMLQNDREETMRSINTLLHVAGSERISVLNTKGQVKMTSDPQFVVKPGMESFTESEKKIVPVLGHHISLSFANAHLYNIAITDGLTTLYTKRHFDMKINEFIHDFHVRKKGFCLLMLDLDHFKEVNDEHGHPVGDRVLVRIAEQIRSAIRHDDIPFRYGGEEFAVLLKGDDIEWAVRIAERVRRSVEETTMYFDAIPAFFKTVSIGVACFPHHYATAEEIVNAADKALYKAKSNGRNQVIVYC